MTWGFVTCGPNEALVVSGSYFSVIEVDVFQSELHSTTY
jgi:hypothetical protein